MDGTLSIDFDRYLSLLWRLAFGTTDGMPLPNRAGAISATI
jgi:hypothetical protein